MAGSRDLVIRIRGDSAEFVSAVEGADRRLGAFERSIDATGRSASSAMEAVVRLTGGISAAFAAREIVRAADDWGQYASRVRMATGSAEEYAHAQNRMLASANETYRSIEETRESFIQMSPVLRQMGLDLGQSIDALDTFSGLLVVNAANAERGAQAQGALSKSLQTGKVDAEAWQSLLRAMPSLVTLLAQSTGMAEAEIRRLGISGKLSINALVRTLIDGNAEVQAQVAAMPTTVADALQNLRNGFTEYVGSGNEALGLTAQLAAGISAMGDNFELLADIAVVTAAAVGGKYASALVLTTAARIKDAAAVRAATLAEIAHQRQLAATAATQAALALTSVDRTAALERQTAALQAATLASARLGAGAGLVRGAIAALGGPVGIVTGLLTAGAAAYMVWGNGADDASAAADTFGVKVDALRTKVTELTRAQAEQAAQELEAPYKRAQEVVAGHAARIELLSKRIAQFPDAGAAMLERWNRALVEARGNYDTASQTAAAYAARLAELNGVLNNTEAAQGGVNRAMSASETDYLAAIERRSASLIDGNDALAQAERWIKANTEATEEGSDAIRRAARELNELQKKQAATREHAIAARKHADALREQTEELRRQAEAASQWAAAQAAAAQQLQESSAQATQSLREELETIGLSATQLAAYRAEKLRTAAAANEHAAAELEAAAAILKAQGVLPDAVEGYRALAQARREAAREQINQASLTIDVAARQASFDAANAVEEEWRRTSESIEQSLTDALMRGFEDGEGFARNFRDALINMFKTLVLRPLIQPIASGAAGLFTGGLSGGGRAGGAMGSVQALSGVSNLAQFGSSAWELGSQYFSGTMSGANALGSVYANATGTGLDGLLATNGAYGTAGSSGVAGGSAMGAGMAGLGAGMWLYNKTGSYAAGVGGAYAGAAAYGAMTGMAGAGAATGASAAAGAAVIPGWGWVAAAVIAVLADVFSKPADPRMIYQMSSDIAAPWEDGVYAEGAFGYIGMHSGSKDVRAGKFKRQFEALAALDNLLASAMTDEQVADVRAAMDGWNSSNDKAGGRDFRRSPDLALAERLMEIAKASGDDVYTDVYNYAANKSVRPDSAGVVYGMDGETVMSQAEVDAMWSASLADVLQSDLPDSMRATLELSIEEALSVFGVAGEKYFRNSLDQWVIATEDASRSMNMTTQELVEHLSSTTEGALAVAEAQKDAYDKIRHDLVRDAKVDGEELAKFLLQRLRVDDVQDMLAALGQSIGKDAAMDWMDAAKSTVKGEDGKDIEVDGFTNIAAALGDVFAMFYATPAGVVKKQFESLKSVFTELGATSVPTSIAQYKALIEEDDLNTEAGRQLYLSYAALAPKVAEVQEAILNLAGMTTDGIRDIIRDGLTGKSTQAEVTAALQAAVIDGIWDAAAGDIATQITELMIGQIINPAINAVLMGGEIADALASGQIEQAVAAIQAKAEAFAAVMADPAVQAAIDAMYTAMGVVGTSVGQAGDAIRDGMPDVVDPVAEMMEALSDEADKLEDRLRDMKSLSAALHSTMEAMTTGTLEEARRSRAAAKAHLETSLALTRASGGTWFPSAAELAPSLDVLKEPSADLFASFEDYTQDLYESKNTLAALAEMADEQIGVDEQTLKFMKDRAALEDEYRDQALAQSEYTNERLAEQLGVLEQILGAVAPAENEGSTGRVKGDMGVRETMTPEAESRGRDALASIGVVAGGPISEAQAKQIYDAWMAGYGNEIGVHHLSDLDRLLGLKVGATESWARQHGLPAFASGGAHAGGWRVVGEAGPELEYTGPSHIYNRSQANALINIEPMVAELRALGVAVARLERAQVATATNTDRTARALDEMAERALGLPA